jgi:hypothetical protein
MKRLLLALALLLAPIAAQAQCNGIFPNNTVCGNVTGSANTPRATSTGSFSIGPGGTSGQIQYNNGVGGFAGFTANGDATINTSTGLVTNSKFNNGTTFGSAAGANTGTSGHAVPFMDGANAWSGAQTFNGNATFNGGTETFNGVNQNAGPTYFGGKPWFDVLSTANGCAAADPTGATDSTAAINCHINYMTSTFTGGIVFVPCGTYLVSGGGVVITNGVYVIAAGLNCATIQTATDVIAVRLYTNTGTADCPAGGHFGGLTDISVFGFQNSAATQPALYVGNNCAVFIERTKLLYGTYGMRTLGTDGTYTNNYICGYAGCVFSTGANWYIRNKLDSVVTQVGTSFGWTQNAYTGPGGAGAIAENHFVLNDLSGSYTDSVLINDSNNSSAITHFDGSVFSQPIILTAGRALQITGSEIGSTTLTNNATGPLIITGTFALSATVKNGTGPTSCAGNWQLTC